MNEPSKILIQNVESGKSPSVQYYFFDRECIIESVSYGHANLTENQLVSAHTTYHAFSVTKTFTALAILQLAEKKLLELHLPVAKYWPNFPYNPAITTQQILNHSAGIPNPIPLNWIHLASEHETFDSTVFFNDIIAKHLQTKFIPNQKFSYSNVGYMNVFILVYRQIKRDEILLSCRRRRRLLL